MEEMSQTYSFHHSRLGRVDITISAPAANSRNVVRTGVPQQQSVFEGPFSRIYLSQALRDLAAELALSGPNASGVTPTLAKGQTTLLEGPLEQSTAPLASPQYAPPSPRLPNLPTSPTEYTALLTPDCTPSSPNARKRCRTSLSSEPTPESTGPKRQRHTSLSPEDSSDTATSTTPPLRQSSPYLSRYDVRPPPLHAAGNVSISSLLSPAPIQPIPSLLAPATIQPSLSRRVVELIHQSGYDNLAELPPWPSSSQGEDLTEGALLLCQPSAPGLITAPSGYLSREAWFS